MNAVAATISPLIQKASLLIKKHAAKHGVREEISNQCQKALENIAPDKVTAENISSTLKENGFSPENINKLLSSIGMAAQSESSKKKEAAETAHTEAKEEVEAQAKSTVSIEDDLNSGNFTQIKDSLNEATANFYAKHESNLLQFINKFKTMVNGKTKKDTDPISQEKASEEIKTFMEIALKDEAQDKEISKAFWNMGGTSQGLLLQHLSVMQIGHSQKGTGLLPTLNEFGKRKPELLQGLKSTTEEIAKGKKDYDFSKGSIKDYQEKSLDLIQRVQGQLGLFITGQSTQENFENTIVGILTDKKYSGTHISELLGTMQAADSPQEEKKAGIMKSIFNYAKNKALDPKTLMAVIPAVSYGFFGIIEMFIGQSFLTQTPKALIGWMFSRAKDLLPLLYMITSSNNGEKVNSDPEKEKLKSELKGLEESIKAKN